MHKQTYEKLTQAEAATETQNTTDIITKALHTTPQLHQRSGTQTKHHAKHYYTRAPFDEQTFLTNVLCNCTHVRSYVFYSSVRKA